MMKTASLSLVLVVIVLGAYAAEREECSICGMYLDLYERTRHVIVFEDHTTTATCSLACAAEIIEKGGRKIRAVKAADFLTAELIDAKKAYYLEGSDVPGVMSYISRLAFSSGAKAASFQRKHGGRIITFDQAVKNQLQDRSD